MARIATLALLLLAATLAPWAGAAEGVAWRSDPEAAKREATASGRLVLLHFSGATCPPCRMMERTVFNRVDVGQAVERDYVPVAVDVETNQPLSKQYGVNRIPADVIVMPNGQLIQKMDGAKSAADYMAALARVAQVARGGAAGPPLSQNSPTGPAPQTPGTSPPWGAATPGREGASAPPVGQFQTNPFAPRVGQQYTLEAGAQPSLGVTPQNANPPTPGFQPQGFALPGSAPPGQPSSPPTSGGAANPFGNAPPPWSNLGSGLPAPGSQPPSSAWQTAAPPSGPSPFAPNGAPGQPPPGTPPFGGAGPQPSVPWQSGPPSPPPQLPKLPPLGFEGFCPVTMFHQERWAVGDRRWGVIHEGRLYLFVSPEAKAAFFGDPNRYAPVFSGDDVVAFVEVGQRVPGQIRIGAKYPPGTPTERMFLFASEQSFQKFNANPALYLERLRQMLSAAASNGLIKR